MARNGSRKDEETVKSQWPIKCKLSCKVKSNKSGKNLDNRIEINQCPNHAHPGPMVVSRGISKYFSMNVTEFKSSDRQSAYPSGCSISARNFFPTGDVHFYLTNIKSKKCNG